MSIVYRTIFMAHDLSAGLFPGFYHLAIIFIVCHIDETSCLVDYLI